MHVTVKVQSMKYEMKFIFYFICPLSDLNVLPESALLVLVWETLAMSLGSNYREKSVIFRNITFYCEAIINPDVPLNLTIAINRGSETFEVGG